MPIPHLPDGGQSALEQISIEQRARLLGLNTYNNTDEANEYSATNTRALSDATTPHYGKGSGQFLDIENYSGVGSDWDALGNPTIKDGIGSGRNPAFANNLATWGYDYNNYYKKPDTSKNKGQVII